MQNETIIIKNQKYTRCDRPDTHAKTIVDKVVGDRVHFHTEGYFDARDCTIELFNERYNLFKENQK
jgi:hypothetical protein